MWSQHGTWGIRVRLKSLESAFAAWPLNREEFRKLLAAGINWPVSCLCYTRFYITWPLLICLYAWIHVGLATFRRQLPVPSRLTHIGVDTCSITVHIIHIHLMAGSNMNLLKELKVRQKVGGVSDQSPAKPLNGFQRNVQGWLPIGSRAFRTIKIWKQSLCWLTWFHQKASFPLEHLF